MKNRLLECRSLGAYTKCLACGHSHEHNWMPENFEDGSTIACPKCAAKSECAKVIREEIRDHFMQAGAFYVLGARCTLLMLEMMPGTKFTYTHADTGIPSDAHVLAINYTPQGIGGFPVELHANMAWPRSPAKSVTVFLVPDEPTSVYSVRIAVLITWISSSFSSSQRRILFSAFDFYGRKDFSSMLVFANVAIENLVATILHRYLSGVTGEKRAKEFLTTSATYGDQLNVVLPALCIERKLPQMEEATRGQLNRLRRLRNDVAHDGFPKEMINEEVAAELLTSTLFGLHYMERLTVALDAK